MLRHIHTVTYSVVQYLSIEITKINARKIWIQNWHIYHTIVSFRILHNGESWHGSHDALITVTCDLCNARFITLEQFECFWQGSYSVVLLTSQQGQKAFFCKKCHRKKFFPQLIIDIKDAFVNNCNDVNIFITVVKDVLPTKLKQYTAVTFCLMGF